jgi:hypothetical protein
LFYDDDDVGYYGNIMLLSLALYMDFASKKSKKKENWKKINYMEYCALLTLELTLRTFIFLPFTNEIFTQTSKIQFGVVKYKYFFFSFLLIMWMWGRI